MNRFDEYKVEPRNGKWVVLGHKGDVKGTHATEAAAQAQVAAIHASMKESVPPRKQWNPVVLSGVRRVKAGEDADVVALDIANRVPGFKRSQLGAYVAAYGSGKKKVTEGFFSAAEPDIADRDNKEKAVQDLLGNDNVDVKKVPDDELTNLLQGLGSITVESIDSQVRDIISVMREQKASRADVLEALQVHIGFNLREAKEVLQEHLREAEEPEEAINWDKKNIDQMTESSKKRAALKEATDISHYMKHARDLLQGVSDIAGLDPEMAALCFAIWNLKLDRTEEDPSAELMDMWSKGEGAISLKNGRRPGPKEAEALSALIQGMNDIIADREENLNRG